LAVKRYAGVGAVVNAIHNNTGKINDQSIFAERHCDLPASRQKVDLYTAAGNIFRYIRFRGTGMSLF